MRRRDDDSSVSVYRFLDAREFLRHAYEARRAADKDFSQRRITQALKAGSSSFFRDVLTGKSKLTPARTSGFARLFGLSKPETEHFENLVAYTQAETEEEKRRALERLEAALPSGRHAILTALHAEYFGKWHYAAIRELLALHAFRGDYGALGGLLNPPVSAAEAKEAVALLLRLRLIRKTPHGGLEPTDRVVMSGPGNTPAQVRPALLGHLDLARRALDALPAAERPFLYATLRVSAETAREIHAKARAFRNEALALAARDEAADRLYQLNLQLFPLSGAVPRRNK